MFQRKMERNEKELEMLKNEIIMKGDLKRAMVKYKVSYHNDVKLTIEIEISI